MKNTSAEPVRSQLFQNLKFIAENRRNAPNEAIKIANESLEIARLLDDRHSECRLHTYLGGINLQKGAVALGKEHLFASLSIYNKYLDDVALLARIKLGIGSYYFEILDFENALLYFFQALYYDVTEVKGALYNNIASVYLKLDKNDEAFEYLLEGLKISEELNDKDRKIFFLINIGSVYYFRKEYFNAINYYNQTAELIEEIQGYQYMKCLCLTRIGIVHYDLKQFETALLHFEKALVVSVEYDLFREEIRILRYIGKSKLSLGSVKAFFDYHHKSIEKANKHDLKQEVLDAFMNIKTYYEEQGNYKEAYQYAEEIITLQKIIFTQNEDDKIAVIASENKQEVELLEQKNLYIQNQNKKLEYSNKVLQEFAYVVSHDLRESLRSIISFTYLLEKKVQKGLDKESKKYLDFIFKSGKHMNDLLGDLLEYATIDKKEIEKQRIDLNEVVPEVNILLKASIKETDAVIFAYDMPSIYANDQHIRQIFQQLIHNAIKFHREDVSPIVTIRSVEKKKHFEFSIQDNGIGIAPDYLEKIFKIFNQLDNKNYEGTGIGLAICQKIVHLYGGETWVESVEGEGSTFYFTIEK